MRLENIVQKTGVVNDGMTIKQGFQECVKNNVPAIPYVDSQGKVTGMFAIRETLLAACIPEVMVEYADLLGDDTACMKIPEEHALKVLSLPVDSFISKQISAITSETAIAKTIAMMEKYKVNYLFVIDNDDYLGVVTIDGIARRMLDLAAIESEQADT